MRGQGYHLSQYSAVSYWLFLAHRVFRHTGRDFSCAITSIVLHNGNVHDFRLLLDALTNVDARVPVPSTVAGLNLPLVPVLV
jgi:hypothetical protein